MLRQFAHEVGLDPSFYGRIERGEVSPPGEELLARIAESLGIVAYQSEEWYRLSDLAFVARGRIPADLCMKPGIDVLHGALFERLREVRGGQDPFDLIGAAH